MSDTSYTGLGSRKSHHKSRLGCLNCKRRRIKCDEGRPQCNNCARHSVPCSYPTASKSPPSSRSPVAGTYSPHHKELKQDAPPSTAEDGLGVEWGPISVELMHNYTTATCFSLSDNPTLQTFMQVNVPKMGFEHKHILHLILSLSALHLARFKPDQKQLYLEHADRHYQAGLRIATALLQNPLPKSDPSVYLFASMCNAFVLAKGPKDGDFLLFSNDGPAEWISLLRGAKALFSFEDESIHRGELAPMIQSGIQAASQRRTTLPPSEMDTLARLRDLVDATSSGPEEVNVLNTAVDNLWTLFSSKFDGSGRKMQAQFQDIGVWLYRCSDEFTALLQQHHPAALVIFAHACIVINDLSPNWAVSGWVPHLLSGIYKNLPLDYHPAIQRPLQEIGWIPPCT